MESSHNNDYPPSNPSSGGLNQIWKQEENEQCGEPHNEYAITTTVAATTPNTSAKPSLLDENARLRTRLDGLRTNETLLRAEIDECRRRLHRRRRVVDYMRRRYGGAAADRGPVDTNLIGKVFSQAQIDYLLEKRKVVWSDDDMARAFTLRHMSNRESYLYLKDTLNVPLPSLSAVQKWFASGGR